MILNHEGPRPATATVLLLALAPLLTACPTDDDPCPACGSPEARGTIENVEIDELSGVAASGRFDDVLYAHNDSSDSSRIFALTTSGTHLATYELTGARNDDWEDIARAQCAFGDCLYIADIGDNVLDRASYSIYLIAEPASIEPGVHSIAAEQVSFTYPDGSHDAEVLLVHPVTGEVTIVTKEADGPASIYALPSLVPDGMVTATKVGEVEPPKGSSKLTGGSVHPDATGILLRTKTRLFYWAMVPEQTVAEALAGEACQLELADETQGEAVTWLRAGDGILTIGEGINPPVNVSRCGE